MKESRITEKTFKCLLIGVAPIMVTYYVLTGKFIQVAFWAFLAVFHVFLLLKQIYDW